MGLLPTNSINIAVAAAKAAVPAILVASFIELKIEYNQNLNYPCPNYVINGLSRKRKYSPKCNERKSQNSYIQTHTQMNACIAHVHEHSPFYVHRIHSNTYVMYLDNKYSGYAENETTTQVCTRCYKYLFIHT